MRNHVNPESLKDNSGRYDFLVGVIIIGVMVAIAVWATNQANAPKPVEEDTYVDVTPNYPW